MSNTINPNSPSNLPPTTNPVDSPNPLDSGGKVVNWEETLSNSDSGQINNFRMIFVMRKKSKAVNDAATWGKDPNEAMRAVDNDPTVKHLDNTISEYEAGRATLSDLAAAFSAIEASLA